MAFLKSPLDVECGSSRDLGVDVRIRDLAAQEQLVSAAVVDAFEDALGTAMLLRRAARRVAVWAGIRTWRGRTVLRAGGQTLSEFATGTEPTDSTRDW